MPILGTIETITVFVSPTDADASAGTDAVQFRIILAVIDVLLLVRGGVDATFSRVILDSSYQHPVIPFAAGVLCGHLFWPQGGRS